MEEFLATNMAKYHGIDYLGMIFSLINIYILGNKKRSGFVFGLISNFCWLPVNIIADSMAGVILNVVLAILNIRGFLSWGKTK